jgi:hypothetical protein
MLIYTGALQVLFAQPAYSPGSEARPRAYKKLIDTIVQ